MEQTTIDLSAKAQEAVELAIVEHEQGLSGGIRIRALKHLYDETRISPRELTQVVEEAMRQTAAALDGNVTPAEMAALVAWSKVSADTTGMLYAVRAAVNVLTGPQAHERLARHLYVTALGKHLRRSGEIEWDEGKANPRDIEHCRARADEMLAVVAGKEE